MYCRNCGKDVAEKAVMCVACGVPPRDGKKYCQNCGAETDVNAVVCVKCGVKLSTAPDRDWLTALLLSLFVGGLGIDRFYTGQIGLGILKLITFGGCGIWWFVDVVLIVTGSYRDSDGRPLVKK